MPFDERKKPRADVDRLRRASRTLWLTRKGKRLFFFFFVSQNQWLRIFDFFFGNSIFSLVRPTFFAAVRHRNRETTTTTTIVTKLVCPGYQRRRRRRRSRAPSVGRHHTRSSAAYATRRSRAPAVRPLVCRLVAAANVQRSVLIRFFRGYCFFFPSRIPRFGRYALTSLPRLCRTRARP